MRIDVEGPDGRVLTIDDGVLDAVRERVATIDAPRSRLAYAAAHVVMRPEYAASPHAPERPGDPAEIAGMIDWHASASLRRRLDGLGFGIAEAMDTAQRFSIGWQSAARLIEECGALGLENGFIAGAGCDHLDEITSTEDVARGIIHQVRVIQAAGGIAMILPTPWLSLGEHDEEAYVRVYRDVIEAVPGPLCIHWLGEAFMSALSGYFPGRSFERIMACAPEKVRACKISLLDAERERAIRDLLLTSDQLVLTGDDFNFPDLIKGDGPIERSVPFGEREVPAGRFSHALLGILDGIAEPASLALRALDAGDTGMYSKIMEPCQELSRHVFAVPTQHYKAGLAFLAWLNGWQDDFVLANHEERTRDAAHQWRIAELGAAAGVFSDAAVAAERLRRFFRSL